MASLLALYEPRLLRADEFLEIDFGPKLKAELDNGVIHMMAGASARHDQIQINLIAALRDRLRGSGCRPSGSDLRINTHGFSVRYPDVSIYCGRTGPEDDRRTVRDDPKVVIEILSPSTAQADRNVKLDEYKGLASVDAVVLIDPEGERVHAVHRAPHGWTRFDNAGTADLDLPTLGLTVPHAEIFARD